MMNTTLSSIGTKSMQTRKLFLVFFDQNECIWKQQKLNCRTTGSLVHLLKSSLGSGILAMPMAFRSSGTLFGAIGTVIVGLICTHCVHILVSRLEIFTQKSSDHFTEFLLKITIFHLQLQVRTSHQVCKKAKVPSLGFAETAEKVFETGPMNLRKYSYAAR